MVHKKTNEHHLQYHVRVSNTVHDALSWCEKNYGPHYDIWLNHPDRNINGIWTMIWSGKYTDKTSSNPVYDFSFKHEKDAITFSLVFS